MPVHPAPPAATAPTPPAADHLWQCELFTAVAPAAPRGSVSARVAYQDAMYGRAKLVDLRPPSALERDGRLPGTLGVVAVAPGADLSGLARAHRLVLILGDDTAAGCDPAEFAAYPPDRPEIVTLHGGFAAWVAAGLPVSP